MKILKKNLTIRPELDLNQTAMSKFKRYALMMMALVLGLGMIMTSVGCGSKKGSATTTGTKSGGTGTPGGNTGTACTNCSFTAQAGAILSQHPNAEFKLNMLSDGTGSYGF